MDRQLWWSYLLKFGQDDILHVDEVFSNFRLHGHSKSVADGELFESEFDRLKHSLLKQLNASEILLKQIKGETRPLNRQWQIDIKDKEKLIAAFAGYYATCSYVKDDWQTTRQLIAMVKKYKGAPFNKTEWKYWISSRLLSEKSLKILKGLKSKM